MGGIGVTNGVTMGMTVLHVVTSTVRRGAEVFAVDLDRALSARGFDTTLRALAPGPEAGSVDIPTLGRHRFGSATLYRLRHEARTRDVVVGHGSSTLPACALATAGLTTPFVYRSIGDPGYWAVSAARHMRTAFLLRRPTVVIALWAGAVGPLVDRFGVDEERIRVIPNAVRPDRFRPASDTERTWARGRLDLPVDASVIAYLGALTPEKDAGAAIEAMAEIPDAVLTIAGEGWERPRLERLAAERAPGRVRFLGAEDDARRVALAAADAVVLPSRTEGVPAALIEAGLSELPVVATAVGGVPEIVADGETGLLVPPGDPSALVEALRAVLEQPRRFGTAARTRCLERFDLEDVAERWGAVLTEASALQRA